MDKVNSAKEMGSIYAGVLMFYVPVLYAIRTRFLKRTKLGIFFWLAEYNTLKKEYLIRLLSYIYSTYFAHIFSIHLQITAKLDSPLFLLFHNHFEYTRFHKNNIHRQLTKAFEK